MASTSSTFFDTSSIGTVQNPYADVKTSLHDSQVPTSNSNTSVRIWGNTDSVVYSTIQHPPRDTTDNGARLLGNPSAGIQSTYARLALSGGLRHDMGGLTGGSNSAVNTSNNPPAPGSHRFRLNISIIILFRGREGGSLTNVNFSGNNIAAGWATLELL